MSRRDSATVTVVKYGDLNRSSVIARTADEEGGSLVESK